MWQWQECLPYDRKCAHGSQKAGHSGAWVKVRAGPVQVGRSAGHLNEEMSWMGVAGVKLEWGLETGSLPGFSVASWGPRQ